MPNLAARNLNFQLFMLLMQVGLLLYWRHFHIRWGLFLTGGLIVFVHIPLIWRAVQRCLQ